MYTTACIVTRDCTWIFAFHVCKLLALPFRYSVSFSPCNIVSNFDLQERKKIIKGMKGHVAKIARDDHGYMVSLIVFHVCNHKFSHVSYALLLSLTISNCLRRY